MMPDLHPFAGGFLMSPIPLELSFSWCSFACAYCFANLNTPRRRSNTTQLLNFLSDYRQRATLEATLLQRQYPVCISNLTDIFAPSNYHIARPVIEILVTLGVPIQVQTRGTDRPAWRDELLSLVPPAVWYISLTTLSERVRERIEPKAPTVASRLALIERLRSLGHTVVVGLNPLVPEWCGDPALLVETCLAAGAQGLWVERLHLNPRQIARMPARDRAALDADLLSRARKRRLAGPDRAVFEAVRAAARACGLPVYSFNQPEPSTFFDLYHRCYPGRTFPTHQDFVNHCYATQAQQRLITFAEYADFFLPHLPGGVYPLDQYIGSTAHTLFQQTRIPARMSYHEVLDLGWRQHAVKFSPVRIPCFAWAAQWDERQQGWLRYTDADGRPFLLFTPTPPYFAQTYAPLYAQEVVA